MKKEEMFSKLLNEAKVDSNIIGFILFGSLGMGSEFIGGFDMRLT